MTEFFYFCFVSKFPFHPIFGILDSKPESESCLALLLKLMLQLQLPHIGKRTKTRRSQGDVTPIQSSSSRNPTCLHQDSRWILLRLRALTGRWAAAQVDRPQGFPQNMAVRSEGSSWRNQQMAVVDVVRDNEMSPWMTLPYPVVQYKAPHKDSFLNTKFRSS